MAPRAYFLSRQDDVIVSFSKKKAGKTSVDFQADLKSMDDEWSGHFARLEAMFLSKSFQVPVEPVKTSDVVVTDRPFIPPKQQSTGVTCLN